jgi:hypothetical protein
MWRVWAVSAICPELKLQMQSMSAFGGKADIAAKLLTRDEARLIVA